MAVYAETENMKHISEDGQQLLGPLVTSAKCCFNQRT